MVQRSDSVQLQMVRGEILGAEAPLLSSGCEIMTNINGLIMPFARNFQRRVRARGLQLSRSGSVGRVLSRGVWESVVSSLGPNELDLKQPATISP